MQATDFLISLLYGWKQSHVLFKNNRVREIVNDGLSKTLVRALPHDTVWVDEPIPFVVSGVANSKKVNNNDKAQQLLCCSLSNKRQQKVLATRCVRYSHKPQVLSQFFFT